MDLRTKLLIGLAFVALVDIVLPLPLAGAFLLYVVAARPAGIKDLVLRLYDAPEENGG